MCARTPFSRILVPAIVAIFLVSSLADSVFQGNFTCHSTLQSSANNSDDNISLDKKHKSCTLNNKVPFSERNKVQNYVSVVYGSSNITHTLIPHFFRAPPLM